MARGSAGACGSAGAGGSSVERDVRAADRARAAAGADRQVVGQSGEIGHGQPGELVEVHMRCGIIINLIEEDGCWRTRRDIDSVSCGRPAGSTMVQNPGLKRFVGGGVEQRGGGGWAAARLCAKHSLMHTQRA